MDSVGISEDADVPQLIPGILMFSGWREQPDLY